MTAYYINNVLGSGPGTPDDSGDPYEDIGDVPAILTGDALYFFHDQTHAFATYETLGAGVSITIDRYGGTDVPNLDGGSAINRLFDFAGPTGTVLIQNVNVQNLSSGTIWGAFKFDGVCSGDITINNISSSGAMPSSVVQFKNATISGSLAITNCDFVTSGTQSCALYFSVCQIDTNVSITGNAFSDSGGDQTDALLRGSNALTTTGSGSLTYDNNTFTSLNRGLLINAIDDCTITNNTFIDGWNQLTYPSGTGSGIKLEGVCTNVTISGNTFVGNNRAVSDGSTGTGTTNIHVIGNTLIDNIVNGVDMGFTGTGNIIAHNNIRHAPLTDVGHGIAIQNGGALGECEIKNNLIYLVTPTDFITSDNCQCIAISGSYADVDINNNQYYVEPNATPLSADIGALSAVNYATFSAWQTALQGDASVSGEESAGINVEVKLDNTDPYVVSGNINTMVGAGASITGINDSDEYGTPPNIGAYLGLLPLFIAVSRRTFNGPPAKRVYPKTQRGTLRDL